MMVDHTQLKDPSPWNPLVNTAIDLKHLGKLAEELGELIAAVSRCTIQGIDGVEPVTGKPNRQWLEEELADVGAGMWLCMHHFKLDLTKISQRQTRKEDHLRRWHQMLDRKE